MDRIRTEKGHDGQKKGRNTEIGQNTKRIMYWIIIQARPISFAHPGVDKSPPGGLKANFKI